MQKSLFAGSSLDQSLRNRSAWSSSHSNGVAPGLLAAIAARNLL
jgi:hypothetical protein